MAHMTFSGAPAPQRQARKRPLLLGGILAVALLVSSSAMPALTEAAWQDNERATGSVTTATIPAASLNGPCEFHATFLGFGAFIRVFWKAPTGYTMANAEVQVSPVGSALTPLQGFTVSGANTTGSPAGYTTDIPSSVLGGVLGFNTNFDLAIVMNQGGWKSQPVTVRANAGVLAGIGGSCTNLG